MSKSGQFKKIYGAASWLGAASLFGLVAALVADGVWDAAACLALSAPIFVIARRWAS